MEREKELLESEKETEIKASVKDLHLERMLTAELKQENQSYICTIMYLCITKTPLQHTKGLQIFNL